MVEKDIALRVNPRVLQKLRSADAVLWTAALTGDGSAQSAQGSDYTAGRAFRLIRENLIRQREWIGS